MIKNVTFILDHKLNHYRTALFDGLCDRGYNIEIYHQGPELKGDFKFQQHVVKLKHLPLGFQQLDLPSDIENSDVIVMMQNIRILNLWKLSLKSSRKYRLIHWGIGVSSSEGLPKSKNIISRLRDLISKKSDALIFYSSYPLKFFSNKNKNKSFIANNTIYNSESADFSNCEKNSFLFIGSINERKGLDVLITAFASYLKENTSNIKTLNIVGTGKIELIEQLKQQCIELGIENYVHFVGAVYKDTEKAEFFKTAVASISPKQAGLSVLESFSYGVPFICYTNAISGGEHLNIKNGFNGHLVNNETELTDIMINLAQDKNKYIELGSNSFNFYKNERSMTNMIDSFDKAIRYTENINI